MRKQRKRISQSDSKREAARRRKAAEPPARFVKGRCDPEVERNLGRDLAILRETFDFRRLPEKHPIRRLWETPTSRARFELQHLADDLRETQGVDGFNRLVKRLKEDFDAYDDTRYELRLGAALARPPTQKLVRFAAEKVGPDVEVTAKSGHLCGVACYRSNSVTPALAAVGETCRELALHFAGTFASRPLAIDLGLEVEFEAFPPHPPQIEEAKRLLTALWSSLETPVLAGTTGVEVRRAIQLPASKPSGVLRRARIRFMFPVPEREHFRSERHVTQKLKKEHESWARTYPGVCVLAVEESGFAHGLAQETVIAALEESGTAFAGVLATQIFHPIQDGSLVHAFERVHPFFRETDLRIHLETYAQNDKSWAGGDMLISNDLKHASELWDVWQSSTNGHVTRVRELELVKQFSKIPFSHGQEGPGDDPAFRADLERVLARMRATSEAVFDV